jgi:hypothetical protein
MKRIKLEKEEQNMHQTDRRKRNLHKEIHTNIWETLNSNPNFKNPNNLI